jgi:hypothetical protein
VHFIARIDLSMPLKTRGSATVDKAQRRLANLKSIDENLDLGYGLTIETYVNAIDAIRIALDSHNTLVSNLDESRKTVSELEKTLSSLSERMLSGVATKYGRDSIQYSKAGGSNRKGGIRTTQAKTSNLVTEPIAATNGKGKTSRKTQSEQASLN